MTEEELNKAKLVIYMTDGNRDVYIAGDWKKYYVEDNYLRILNVIENTHYFQVAIYNMNYVEKAVIEL